MTTRNVGVMHNGTPSAVSLQPDSWHKQGAYLNFSISQKIRSRCYLSPDIYSYVGDLAISVGTRNDIYVLEKFYILRERKHIFEFLQENPFLYELLKEAYLKIHKYFFHPVISLELNEYDEGKLIAYIGTDLDADDAFLKLKQFDKEWWLSNLERAQGKLIIDIEFQ